MADTKISALTELAEAPATADEFVIVDKSDTSMAASGTNKKLTATRILSRANHTGTQTASTISDFDTEVSNNSSVTANTAKVTNANHTGDVTGDTALTIAANAVDDTHIDWGTGANQVSAIDVPIADSGVIITATEVEGALQENRTAIDLNTSKVTNANHTGDATGDTALTIAADAVTYSKMQNVVADERILGRVSGANGIVEELTKAQVLTMINVEDGADVTDTANVTAAGALMDSEVDADIKTLVLPASTTISTFGATVIDDANAAAARTTLGVDASGTDNSTDVTLVGTGTYLSLAGQAITVDPITESDISDLQSYITGASPTITTPTITLKQSATPTPTAEGDIQWDTDGNNLAIGDGAATQVITPDASQTVLGTIATGVWQGTAINQTYLVGQSGTNTGDEVAASPTVAGVSELSTIAEIDIGADTVRTITPAGLSGSALQTKVDGIEALADVTDTANVTSAGALMDSEVDADIKTLVLPASTTISAFGATVIDDATAAAARTTLGVDAAGTDNSTDVTLAGTGTYISIVGQVITVDPITESDISDLAHTPEGTAVLSTGEVGGTKFLREDGDGTCSWQAVAGGGDVTKVGTPVNSQIGVWTGDGTIEGATNLTYDGANLQLTGDIGATGTRITKGWFTDLQVTNAIAGSITGNAATVSTITGLAPDTATTQAAQPNITSLGTLTTLSVDNITINGNDISSTAGTDLTITPLAGQQIVLDSTIVIDAGVVTGATSITSTAFVGALTGQADTVATITGLAPDTATTQATQASITTAANLTTVGTVTTGNVDAVVTRVMAIAVVEGATDTAVGDKAGNSTFRIPSILGGYNLTDVEAHVETAGTTGTTDIQIHNVTQAADMLSTKITIDSAETDSSTAATPPVIDTANDDVATGDKIRVDVDAVSTTAAKGLSVELTFQLP